jgi:Phosphatidylserine synthase
MIKHIPNAITCLNLFAGAMACIMVLLYDNFIGGLIFICFAAVFDFFDGFAARFLKAYSPLGAQLDSLADVVSFGLAPGFIVFQYLLQSSSATIAARALPFLALLIPVFAAIRLAKFNIDTKQTDSFLGLPVPANGLFWASFILAIKISHIDYSSVSIFIPIGILIFCFLMVCELPMFSLKFKQGGWKNNEWAVVFLLFSLIIIIAAALLHQFLWSIPTIILLYISMSIVKSLSKHK